MKEVCIIPAIKYFLSQRRIQKILFLLNTAFIYAELSKRHYFVDGDKRTAHIFAKAFLMSEGFHFSIPYKTAVDFIISIAKDDVSINRIKKWLEDNSVKIKEKDIESYIKKEIENL
ncbi:MAG: hypothetical protein HYT73_02425 [Candidatus Aenigmarchaeota archaeon]|nr:hypothetical protein [Candidatus Aenigmarchaeota archaeon]